MGGKKRKISMKKIESKDSRAVAFSKRRNGLYSKTSELCLLSDAQVAILATPVSSNSNVSFYSFGHSSVDSVVSAFLTDQRPSREDVNCVAREGLGFWWEDESLLKSENSEELSDAVEAISSMLQNLKGLHSKAVENLKRKKKDHQELGHNQTLNLKLTSASPSSQDDSSFNQIVTVSDNDDNNGLPGNSSMCNEEFSLDQTFDLVTKSEGILMDDALKNQKLWYGEDQTMAVSDNNSNNKDFEAVEYGAMVIHSKSDEDQIVASSDINNNNNSALSAGDLEQVFDFVSSSECLSMNLEIGDVSMTTKTNQNSCSSSEAVEDGAVVVIHKDLAEDNLDVFSELTSITAL